MNAPIKLGRELDSSAPSHDYGIEAALAQRKAARADRKRAAMQGREAHVRF